MRITEKIVADGEFWLPSDPQRKIPGKLTISDGGEIELEITNVFGDWRDQFNDTIDISRILGATEKGRVTLDNCFYLSKKLSLVPGGSASKARIHVNKAILGVAYETDETATFNTFSFSVEGLEDWLCIRPITVDVKDFPTKAFIKYSRPKDIFFCLFDRMKIQLTFGATLPGFSVIDKAEIKHNAYIKLVSKEERPVSDFIAMATKINSFFSFAIDKIICIKDVRATSKNVLIKTGEKGKKTPLYMEIFYQSPIFSPKKPTTHSQEMLFVFPDIKKDIKNTISKWIEIYDTTHPALNLCIHKANTYKYLEDKFLTLSQGLEIYHQKTYKKKSHLDARFHELLTSFSNLYGVKKQTRKIATDIAGIRNYLTHYSNKHKDKAKDPETLYFLYTKMQSIFQLHFLRCIGFNDEEIEKIAQKNYQLKRKLKEITHSEYP